MKCLSLIRNHTGTFTLFCLLFVSFFVSSLSVSNSYAVDDYSVTLTKNDRDYIICYDGNTSVAPVSCSDYSYVRISNSSPFETSSAFFFSFRNNNYGRFQSTSFFYSMSTMIISIDCGGATSCMAYNRSSPQTLSSGLTFTLTDSLSSDSPSGSLSITQNGTYDVTSYAEAVVDVPPEIVYGDYHNDLINITNGIYVCAGTILVIYFFYCIYRLIIKNSGVK